MMDVWFTKPQFGDAKLFLIAGLSEKQATHLTDALNMEFPDCNFWAE